MDDKEQITLRTNTVYEDRKKSTNMMKMTII